MVHYILASVGDDVKLDRYCSHCKRPNGNIHSGIRHRRISDTKVSAIAQRRMKCPYCRTTWTLRAEGIGHCCHRSERLRGFGVMLYMFGLSYRKVEASLRALGHAGGKSSIERDVDEAGQKAKSYHALAPRVHVRVLGVDGTGAAMAGKNAGVLFFTDVERKCLLLIEPIQEKDVARLRRHVAKVMADVRAEELRSDEHPAYKGIVSEDRHRICLAHWRKSKGKRAYDLCRLALVEDRPLEAESMRKLLELLRMKPRPPTVPGELSRLVRCYINCRKGLLWQINRLLQDVERTWEQVSNDSTDSTNNVTERLIGLTFKIRAKTMRGFKSERKVLAHPYLASFLRGEEGFCDLRKVI